MEGLPVDRPIRYVRAEQFRTPLADPLSHLHVPRYESARRIFMRLTLKNSIRTPNLCNHLSHGYSAQDPILISELRATFAQPNKPSVPVLYATTEMVVENIAANIASTRG